MKLIIYLFIILLFNCNLYNQEVKNNLLIKYHQGINYYLAPNNTDLKREVLFIAMPPFVEPEYSVALETKENITFLRLRFFKSHYWETVFSQRKSNTEIVYNETDCNAIIVSKDFADKFKLFVQIIIDVDPILPRDPLLILDDNVYWVFYNNNKREFHEYDISNNKRYRKLVTVCESVANDIRNKNFNEIKYIDLIDSLLTTEMIFTYENDKQFWW